MATTPWARVAGLMVGAWMAAAAWGTDLVVTGSTNRWVIQPDQPGQRIRLFLENRGAKSYVVLGGTFTVIVSPSTATPASLTPRITQARLVGLEGSPLLASRLLQTDYPTPTGAWMSTVEALSFLPSRRVFIQPGARWPLCDIDLDSTGIREGAFSWQLRLDGLVGGSPAKSFFNIPSDTDPTLTLEVPVVAEPMVLLLKSSLPTVPPPIAVRLDPSLDTLIFEAEAGMGEMPAIEVAEDPVNGTWTSLRIPATQMGAKWRWQVPFDPQVPARFFRSANATPGGLGSGRAAE